MLPAEQYSRPSDQLSARKTPPEISLAFRQWRFDSGVSTVAFRQWRFDSGVSTVAFRRLPLNGVLQSPTFQLRQRDL